MEPTNEKRIPVPAEPSAAPAAPIQPPQASEGVSGTEAPAAVRSDTAAVRPAYSSGQAGSPASPPPPAATPRYAAPAYSAAPFSCDRAEFWLWPLAVLMGYLLFRLVFEHGTGLAAVLFIAGVYLTTAVYMTLAHIKPVWSGPCIAWTALTAALTASLILLDGGTARQVIVLLCTLLCAAVQLYTMLGCRRYGFDERAPADWADAVLCAPFANLGAFWQTLGAMLKKGRSRAAIGVLVGFVVGLPLLIILVLLLASADNAFDTFITRYVSEWFSRFDQVLLRLFGGIPFAMLAFGLLYGERHRKKLHRIDAGADARRIPASAACGLLIPVTVLYLVYLGTQGAYFFSAFAGLLPEGFTYAEYARRGFFELCAICAINLGLIAALTSFVRFGDAARRFFRSFLAVFSLVLAGTALSKMFLYMRTYGLTPLRLQTTVFIIALALVFLWVLIKTWFAGFPAVRLIAVTAAAALLLFAYTDADAVSLKYNLDAIDRGVLSGSVLSDQAGVETQSCGGFSYYDLLHMSDGIDPILRSHPSGLADSVLSERARDRAERSWLAWNLAAGSR